ncbi:MAG: FKBP-type peptidyl-prolyl cis-trans isomerase [Candidatus Eremiobacteraeota bacterium]|nr:FKBP-type peptidyl-prolyl cis-trans isomerase [Candidatus Eremiobacteraeota bacterium]
MNNGNEYPGGGGENRFLLACFVFMTVWIALVLPANAKADSRVAPLTSAELVIPKGAYSTHDGIRYVILKTGANAVHATPHNDVTIVAYGWWSTGVPINSPDLKGNPYTYHLRHLIKGWQEAVALMTPGETARFWMPASVTHSTEHGNAPGAMIFQIHLLSVRAHHGAEERPGTH